MTRHLVLCGGLAPVPGENGQKLELTVTGKPGGIDLRIEQLRRYMVSDNRDTLIDLLEIAAYVYAADSQVTRGGIYMQRVGADWRRQFKFAIPVRNPELWSSPLVRNALVETLGFLSDDSYDFRFERLEDAAAWQCYFDFWTEDGAALAYDEILLFSGGLDSFAGLLTEIKGEAHRVVLVSHRSSPKMLADQSTLLKALGEKIGGAHFQHVPVRLTLAEGTASELTHRTRAFLYAALGLTVAQIYGRQRLRFYENGVTSLHFPISAHVLGARATRSTHPRVLVGLTELFSRLLGAPFVVENPYSWWTKADVVKSIVGYGCGDHIALTRSCANVRGQTTMHSHCGCCSQCIDRRFATLAAAAEDRFDPESDYCVDLLQGPREPFEQVSMLASYVSTVSKVDAMNDRAFFATFGEAARVYRYLSDPAALVGEKIYTLYKRHAANVCRVLDEQIAANAPLIRANILPSSCLLMIAASERSGQVGRPAVVALTDTGRTGEDLDDIVTGGRAREPEILVAFDEEGRRVVLEELGEVAGASFDLLNVLRRTFRSAREAELLPKTYPFLKATDFAQELSCDEGGLRARLSRFRKEVAGLCKSANRPDLPHDAIVENLPWHGYRLNPFRVRLVALSELKKMP